MTLKDELLSGIAPETMAKYGLDQLPFDQLGKPLRDSLGLDGKRAVIVGGGGKGLGSAISHRLAELGAQCVVVDLDGENATKVAEDIRSRWQVFSSAIAADVATWESISGAIAESNEMLGGIDILVNNAGGTLGAYGLFVERTIEQIEATINVNLLGPMYSTRAALPVMLAAHTGRIINVASEIGKLGYRWLVSYAAAKTGLIGFTRNIAHELTGTGVSIAAVCPGPMLQPATFDRLREGDRPDIAAPPNAALDEAMSRVSIGRAALPIEVANMVAFLAGPAGAYVHGTAVSVGGGMSD